MIKFYYFYQGTLKQKLLSVEDVVSLIRSGKYNKSVEKLREEVRLFEGIEGGDFSELTEKIPSVVWSQGENGYTGYVLLSLHCKGDKLLSELRKVVNSYLHVVCSFKGSSGCSLKVVMAFSLNDGELAGLNADDVALFHVTAYHKAAAFLQATTGLMSTGCGSDINGGCRISVDEEAYYNPNATAIKIDMPVEKPETLKNGTRDIDYLAPKNNTIPDYTETETEVTRFNLLRRTLHLSDNEDDATDVLTIAEACAKVGLMQEIATKCTLRLNRFKDKTMLVRTAFEESYDNTKRSRKSRAVEIPRYAINGELMQRHLRARYRFRQNEVTGSVEYAELNVYAPSWKPFDERVRNTICMELQKAGINVWDRDVDRYVNSTLITTYDPITDWLVHLPAWDGRDRVGELAATVKTNWEPWTEMFRIWMRSMVSQWKGINRIYGATMVLMLTGSQGTRKSTFCKRILPPELNAYYVDRIDFTNKKDAERALMRFCLINLDEFDQISPRQTAFLKHMLQKSSIMYRKMYQDDIEQRKRYAAFCATTNSDAPLTDPTGSRRYLVVDVAEAIDVDYTIDYQQLYAQLVYEVRHDLPSYFDAENERIIQEHNLNYTEEMPLATMFDKTFDVAAKGQDCLYLTSSEIIMKLKERYKSNVSVNRSTSTKLGAYLASRNIRTINKDTRRVYALVLKDC